MHIREAVDLLRRGGRVARPGRLGLLYLDERGTLRLRSSRAHGDAFAPSHADILADDWCEAVAAEATAFRELPLDGHPAAATRELQPTDLVLVDVHGMAAGVVHPAGTTMSAGEELLCATSGPDDGYAPLAVVCAWEVAVGGRAFLPWDEKPGAWRIAERVPGAPLDAAS